MDLDLCKGIAVVVDDKAFPKQEEDKDAIVTIIDKLRLQDVPLCIYTDLTKASKAISNFSSVSFLILDWDMQGKLKPDVADKIIKPSQANRVVKFIKDFREICFCPIFIFSNADIGSITEKLISSDLYFDDDTSNFIHIQSKKDLIRKGKVLSIISSWINNNPTNYTLKNWELSFSKAKTDTFWHLFSKSPVWPRIMWQSFKDDGIDPQSNLNEVIYRLIKSRTNLLSLESRKVNRRKHEIRNDEIKDVIQGTMFLDNDKIPEYDIRPGDIFKKSRYYYINIRPECDTIVNRDEFDGKIYLLKGGKISGKSFRKSHYNRKYGIIPSHVCVLLYGLDGKDFIRFNFKELITVPLDDFKNKRICRLLTPYINSVQQQYSSYVGRIGLPRLPKRVIKEIK